MSAIKIPVITGDYVRVFRPAGGVYPGPDGKELRHGEYYRDWVPNDHAFVSGPDGCWHIFGITHPLTSIDNVHEGEVQLFHARASGAAFDTLSLECFEDLGCVLPPERRPGEPKEIHSPYIVKIGGLYHMIYGPTQFRLAQSADLFEWTMRGVLFSDGEGASRDPQIMQYNGFYHLCYCSGNEVRMRRSRDLRNWDGMEIVLRMPAGICPESPFLLHCDGIFYLLVCTWQGEKWNRKTISGAYQHQTLVFAAKRLDELGSHEPVTVLEAHAPEVIEIGGKYFISSAEWPERGINVAELRFR